MKVWTVYCESCECVLGVCSTEAAALDLGKFYGDLWHAGDISDIEVEEWTLDDADMHETMRKRKVRYDYLTSPEGIAERDRVVYGLLALLEARKAETKDANK